MGPGARVLEAVLRLSSRRSASPAFRSATPDVIDSGHGSVVAFTRSAGESRVTVAVNFSENSARTSLTTEGEDWNGIIDPSGPLVLEPYGVRVWESGAGTGH
jgi:hypothetical protein